MQLDIEIWLDTNISPIIAKWMGDYLNVTVKSSYTLNFNHDCPRLLSQSAVHF